jgi:hypothetical protein
MFLSRTAHTRCEWLLPTGPSRTLVAQDSGSISRRHSSTSARISSCSSRIFYDWYADLPVASPQVFGDQTDVPESGDWWDTGYLITWGSNLPVTRTPDAHWMALSGIRTLNYAASVTNVPRRR